MFFTADDDEKSLQTHTWVYDGQSITVYINKAEKVSSTTVDFNTETYSVFNIMVETLQTRSCAYEIVRCEYFPKGARRLNSPLCGVNYTQLPVKPSLARVRQRAS